MGLLQGPEERRGRPVRTYRANIQHCSFSFIRVLLALRR